MLFSGKLIKSVVNASYFTLSPSHSRKGLRSLTFITKNCIRSLSTFESKSTIYALSSGSGKCGVAVIRVSGNETTNVMLKMTKLKKLPKPREAILTNLYNYKTGEHLDKALVLWFPGPKSFTGEDVCEFHVHGGNAVISSVFRALSEIQGLKAAEPGEYTKRAFLNEKLDLTEVEGLGDLIHAETEEQRKQALKQMDGRLKSVIQQWSNDLLNCLAHLEAHIDFGEDQHIDDGVVEEVSEKLNLLEKKISKHLNDKRRGEILRSGVRVAIIGKPNSGKSSLLNLITARPTAIVSPIAGTTRDIVESTLDIDGFPVILSDTAGIRNTSDVIEIEGVRRAKVTASEADLVIHIIDATEVLKKPMQNYTEELTHELMGDMSGTDQKIIYILNKCDLLTHGEIQELKKNVENCSLILSVMSCETQTGFGEFIDSFSSQVRVLCSGDDSSKFSPSLTQERHRMHVSKCLEGMHRCSRIIHSDVVIAAEYLRLAMNQLGQLSGKIGAEDILEVIFKDFCIGK